MIDDDDDEPTYNSPVLDPPQLVPTIDDKGEEEEERKEEEEEAKIETKDGKNNNEESLSSIPTEDTSTPPAAGDDNDNSASKLGWTLEQRRLVEQSVDSGLNLQQRLLMEPLLASIILILEMETRATPTTWMEQDRSSSCKIGQETTIRTSYRKGWHEQRFNGMLPAAPIVTGQLKKVDHGLLQ